MSDTAIMTLKTMLANLDDAKKYQSLRDVMETLPAPDLAAVFEDLPPEKLPVLFRLCPKDLAADIFAELTAETQQNLIDGLTDKELKAVVDELFVDDATDLVEEMPASVVKRILAQAEPATRRMINELLQYPEDSAGGVMTTEFMELRPDMTVTQAMESIRANGIDKETINNCYVTDKDRTLIGVVSLRALVLEKDERLTYSRFFDYLTEICQALDIPTPVLMKTHIFNFAKFNHVNFLPRDFVESFDYDRLVLENIHL